MQNYNSHWLQLQNRLSYTFKDPYLLREAFTHPSYLDDKDFAGNNQRLEFFGDSVLGMLVAERLYKEFPGLKEGPLTHLKSTLVSEKVLAQVALELEMDPCIRMGKNSRKSHHKAESYRADAVESLIAALYLDGGWQIVQEFRDRIFWPIAFPLLNQEQMTDYKGILLRYTQSLGLGQPLYEDIGKEGPDHSPQFLVKVFVDGVEYATAKGRSKKLASTEAARLALELLKAKVI